VIPSPDPYAVRALSRAFEAESRVIARRRQTRKTHPEARQVNTSMRLKAVENAPSSRPWVRPACAATVAVYVLVSGVLAPAGLLEAQTVTLKVVDWNIITAWIPATRTTWIA
jgi:hypothetical protein